jgi:glutathione S-transferase
MHPDLLLYTDSSPNGFKATIALEELALPYALHHVRIDRREHRQPAFLAHHPHGRIPVLVDPSCCTLPTRRGGCCRRTPPPAGKPSRG